MKFSDADLPIDSEGRIYHLALRPEELAQSIILVGDPERVPFISEAYLSEVEVDVFHRGLRTITGTTSEDGLRVSIITSGMGTPSLEIVLQEIAALNEIDFSSRSRKSDWPVLNLIRVGTSGALHSDLPLGTAIVSRYALGLDNTGLFYEVAAPDSFCEEIEQETQRLLASVCNQGSRFNNSVRPYATSASIELADALTQACQSVAISHREGITVSNSGFFANQGRNVARISPSFPDIDRALCRAKFKNSSLRFENMEMETSFLFHFAHGLGYRAAAICPGIANRADNTFAASYQEDVLAAAGAALRAFSL
jgi:uridine phosphorylase